MSMENPSVIIVEDEWLLLQAITKKLKTEGITPIPFEGGVKAIDYLNKASDIPDVIWLDYQLKDMDGLEFINKLKRNAKCANIPIIVVSNSASEEKVHSMLALGVKEYLLKAQYRLDEIIAMVRKIISDNKLENS